MDSLRFARPIRITSHAKERMAERRISDALLIDLIETGVVRHKDETRFCVFKHYPERDDNLICAAAVLEDSIVINRLLKNSFRWSQLAINGHFSMVSGPRHTEIDQFFYKN